ncbi:uncharacterized protein CBL_12628 [Carabus blaptoides fortunei]
MTQIRVFYIVSFLLLATSTHGFQWYCSSHADCTTKNTYCTEVGLCQCKDGLILSDAGTECIALATAPDYVCKEQRQCTDVIFGPVSCTGEFCRCDTGYRYLTSNSTCIKFKYLNEECKEDIECYDDVDLKAMKCKDSKCACNDGYYNRGDIDCRLSAKVSKSCMFDVDCQSETKYCKTEYTAVGTCEERATTTTTTAATTTTTTAAAAAAAATTTIQNIPVEESEEILKESINETQISDINNVCTTDLECKVENTHCSKLLKKCICNRLYYYDASADKCIPTVGQNCQEKCSKNAECINGKCQCKPYYINGYLDDKCLKPAKNINHTCVNNKNCYSLGRYAMCSDTKCVCRSQKFDDQLMLCILGTSIGSTCSGSNSCVLEQTECIDGKCLCKENFVAIDEQTCSLQLGQSCHGQEEYCKVNNAICNNNGTYVCKEGYLTIDKGTCLPELTSIKDTCNSNLQCTNLLKEGAQCIDNICKCTDAYKLMDGRCALKRYMGDVCTSRKDCQLVLNGDVRCRNSQCTCAYGYIVTDDKQECVMDGGSITINQGYFLKYTLILALTIYALSS